MLGLLERKIGATERRARATERRAEVTKETSKARFYRDIIGDSVVLFLYPFYFHGNTSYLFLFIL